MNIPGFVPGMIRWCTMHCVNLGILQNFNGSVVSLLMEHGFLKICLTKTEVLFSYRVWTFVMFSEALMTGMYFPKYYSYLMGPFPLLRIPGRWKCWWQISSSVCAISALGKGKPIWDPHFKNHNVFFWCFFSRPLHNNFGAMGFSSPCTFRYFTVSSHIQFRHSQQFFNSGLMSTSDGFPTLCCKAFNGRLLLIFLDVCLHALVDSGNFQGNAEVYNACTASRALKSWYDLLERSPRFLDNTQRVELHGLAMKSVRVLERLAYIAMLNNRMRWRLQPKVHPFIHIAEDHLWFGVNARFVHCYIDEDSIGLMKRLALRVHRGSLMELRMLCRFLLRLGSWTGTK